MEPDDAAASPDRSVTDPTDASDPAAPDLASAIGAGGHEEEPPGASTQVTDPVDAPPAGETPVPVEEETTVPLEADEARLLGGVTPDAIAAEADAPEAVTGAQAEAQGTVGPTSQPPPHAGDADPARLGTDAPAAPGPDGAAPNAPSSLPASPGELMTAVSNSMIKRVVPVVSVAAIAALIFRSLRRRSR